MSEPLTAEELDAYKDSMADSMVGSLGKPAVLRLFATIAALTERAENAEARVAELEELVTSLWMHKPGDCDACNKIAWAALEGKR